MMIEYNSSRREVAQYYWYLWRTSSRLRWTQLFLFVATSLIFFVARCLAQSSMGDWSVTPNDVMIALGFGFVFLLFLPLYPQFRFKSQRRRLSISPEGLTTTIGAKAGSSKWVQIERIDDLGVSIMIVNRTLNAFIVPARAFAGPEEREAFLRCSRDWHAQALRNVKS